jgi:guanine deaminase
MTGATLFRAALADVRGNPFHDAAALRVEEDGGLLVRDGRVAARGAFEAVRTQYPDVEVVDRRGGVLLPGFVDTHVHFPQIRIIGGLGRTLLDWLEQIALPEEARMADVGYAQDIARRFVSALTAHGTTTALVFGAHFGPATAALFDEASAQGLRVASGLVLSDRHLRPELHQQVEAAYRDSTELIRRYHGQGRARYAITPRFALSVSPAMFEMCQTLMREHDGLLATSHINENHEEIASVRREFSGARDYFSVYETYGLHGGRAVLAHNVHPTASELERMAADGTTIAHCPASNAALGSGIFPFARHLAAGVRVALGSDVGGGTGPGMLKEALAAYLMQRVAPDGPVLDVARLLYLTTLAGAEALGLDREIGSFDEGKAADFVYVRPPSGSVLEGALERAEDMTQALAAVFTLAGAESVREVWIEGVRARDLKVPGSEQDQSPEPGTFSPEPGTFSPEPGTFRSRVTR